MSSAGRTGAEGIRVAAPRAGDDGRPSRCRCAPRAPEPDGRTKRRRLDRWSRKIGKPRASWLVAATALCVCVPPGPSGLGSGVQVSVGDVASVLLVVVAGCWALLRRWRLAPVVLLAFGPLVAALTVSTICSQDVAASLPGYVRVVQIFVLVPLAVVVALRDRRDVAVVAGAVVVVGVAEAGYGVWQAVTRTGASFEGRNVRAVGTFGATDVMAMATVAGFAVFVVVAIILSRPGRARAVAFAALAVLAAGLLLSLSRGSWIAVGAGVLIMLVWFDLRVALRTALCVAAAAVVLVGGLGVGSESIASRTRSIAASVDDPDQSVNDRYSLWGTATAIWGDHPVTGVGVKNFPAFRDTYAPIQLSGASETDDPVNGYLRQPLLSPHNQYLLVLSEQGVLGLTGFLLLFALVLRGLWAGRAAKDMAWLAAVGFTGGLMINFGYSDLGGPTCVLTSIMLGLAAARALNWERVRPAASTAPAGKGTAGAPVTAP
ncbi:O-antigen ligase family protein [Actinomadura hibisca]|uniref:O-antigen ligase family protein n=1 Tax=Actinomadura hibisca TaxID=68565 RepID=UPI0012F7E1A4|nr:O-antigen ligase family protein [Actinomadura hibisca]